MVIIHKIALKHDKEVHTRLRGGVLIHLMPENDERRGETASKEPEEVKSHTSVVVDVKWQVLKV